MTRDPALSRRSMLGLLAGGAALAAGVRPTGAAPSRISTLIVEAQALPSLADRIAFISRSLLGTPYRGATLIGGPELPEQFVTRDDCFDCVTFCESVLAAAMARTPGDYPAVLRAMRYRGGLVDWRERNHYFSEWSENNIANGMVRPVFVPGSVATDKPLGWMPELGERRMTLRAIPRASLLAHRHRLSTGVIIGFISERPNLDFFHTGFVVIGAGGGLWLRHASKSKRRVLDEKLERFLNASRGRAVTLLRAEEARADEMIA
ncbi:MAG TPA: N-acetylmuramoyl-L-alanine amidase-like domain-containing protein [Kaistia sp.]|nr:N-acetylmuramoyl-L-alanine amidase-like domain-containing protein [Kaistia sp.]